MMQPHPRLLDAKGSPMTARSTLAASALILLALAGCTTGGGGAGDGGTGTGSGASEGSGTGDGTTGTEASGDASTECLSRTWALDVPDSATQLGDYLRTSGGMNVTQSEGSGAQLMTFNDDGTASSDNDVSYIVTVDDGELVLTLVQTHSGAATGEWAWSGDGIVAFPGWDSGTYTIQTQVLVNGTASPTQVNTPSGSLAEGSTMTVVCSGDSLTTKIDVSPFTQHWTARD